jgi:DUF4097 and DUF4098 domain-containing protein YvlB
MMRRLLIALTLLASAAPARTALAVDAQEPVTRLRTVERRVVRVEREGRSASVEAEQRRTDERETQTERITRSVNIGASGELDLSNIAGDIVITRASGTTALIEAVKTARGATVEEAREMLALVPVEITERGTRVEARTRYPSGDDRRRTGRRNLNVSVAFTVAAPEGTRILVKSISGNISARDILGGLTLESVSGSIRIANAGRMVNGRSISGDIELNDTKVEGALEAGTISGTVRLRRLTARSLTVNSVSGSVVMEDVTAERVGAQSISGDITYGGDLQPNGRYELAAHSGNIRLALPASTGFQLEATSFSGSINTDIPVTMSGGQNGRRSRALRGTAGGGGAFLDLTTFSGSIIIVKR